MFLYQGYKRLQSKRSGLQLEETIFQQVNERRLPIQLRVTP